MAAAVSNSSSRPRPASAVLSLMLALLSTLLLLSGRCSHVAAAARPKPAAGTLIAAISVASPFPAPTTAQVAADGRLYVCDQSKSRISLLQADGLQLGPGFTNGLHSPYGIALSASGASLYAANTATGTVVKLHATTGAVQSTVSGLQAPLSVAINASGALFISQLDAVVVVPVSGPRVTVQDALHPFVNPVGLTLDTHGNLYVCDPEGGRVVVFDSSFAVVQSITAGGRLQFPKGVAVDNTGSVLYIADENSGFVTVVDAASGDFIADYSIAAFEPTAGTWPSPLAVQWVAGELYVVDNHNGEVVVLDASSGAYIRSYPEPFWQPNAAVVSSTGYKYVATANQHVVVLSPPNRTEVDDLLLNFSPVSLAIDISHYLYAVNGSGIAQQLLPSNGAVVATFPVGSSLSLIAVSKSGSAIFAVDKGGLIIRFTASQSATLPSWTAQAVTYSGLSVNPSGSVLYVTSPQIGGTVAALNSSSGQLLSLLPLGAYNGNSDVSGWTLGAVTVDTVNLHVYVLDLSNRRVAVLGAGLQPGATLANIALPAGVVDPVGVAVSPKTHNVFVLDGSRYGRLWEFEDPLLT